MSPWCQRREETDSGAKRLSMGERWLLSWMRRGVVLEMSFTYNSGVCCFNEAWLSKATDIVGGKRENIK
jgi:hypothetical protein